MGIERIIRVDEPLRDVATKDLSYPIIKGSHKATPFEQYGDVCRGQRLFQPSAYLMLSWNIRA